MAEKLKSLSGFTPPSPGSRSKPLSSHYRPPNLSQPQVRRKPSWAQSLLLGSTITITTVLSAIAGVGLGYLSPWHLTERSPESAQTSFLPYHLTRPINILVLGIDRVADAPPESREAFNGRSDTILLVRLDPTQKSLKLLSVPRDTRVFIPDIGHSKVNEANVQGGAMLAATVVSQTLEDVPIDRYVRVTTNVFRGLVDLVGGVEVYVPSPMVYQDITQKLNIRLEAGQQLLNGDQAEQFARFRNDGHGDIGRVQRQEVLLKALQARLKNPALITRLPQAIALLQQSVDTNMTMEELLAIANFGYQLQREQVQTVMLPGRFSQPTEYSGRSYWIVSEQGRHQVMEQYFGLGQNSDTPTPRSLERFTIAIQNATDDPAIADAMQRHLQSYHFRNVYITTESPKLLAKTEIVAQKGDLRGAKMLQDYLGGGEIEASSTGDLGSDFTLRLGLDARQFLVPTKPHNPPQLPVR